MKKTLFSLCPNDEFYFNGKIFKLIKYKNKFMPTLGKCLNAVCVGEDGKESWFIRNHEVILKEHNEIKGGGK